MTKKHFINIQECEGFNQAMEVLSEERDDITTYDTLRDFIIELMKEDNSGFALHLLKAIYDSDSHYQTTDWFRYDYSMGTLETPTEINSIEDVEDLFDEE